MNIPKLKRSSKNIDIHHNLNRQALQANIFIRIPKKERIFCFEINLVAIFEQKGPANEWNDFGTLGLGRHSCSAPVIIMHSMHNSGMAHLTMWCMVWCCGGAWWRFIFHSSDHTPAPFLSIMCMHKRSFSKKGKNQQSPQKIQLTSSVPYMPLSESLAFQSIHIVFIQHTHYILFTNMLVHKKIYFILEHLIAWSCFNRWRFNICRLNSVN